MTGIARALVDGSPDLLPMKSSPCRLCHRLAVLLLLALAALPCALRAAPLRAGAATADITPAIGTVMNGGIGPNPSTHVHDELLARCLVLDDGTNRLAFVVLDNCLIQLFKNLHHSILTFFSVF